LAFFTILELLKTKPTVSFEKSRTTPPATQRNIPQNGNPPLHRMKTSKWQEGFYSYGMQTF